jgi:threonine/homoserine/homoserine lactone efflux protein
VIGSGILVNVLNPKLTIFFVAFLPQFVGPQDPRAWLRMLELSAVFMVVTLVVFVLYGAVAAAVRSHVIARPGIVAALRRAFGGAFVALAGRLAVTDR